MERRRRNRIYWKKEKSNRIGTEDNQQTETKVSEDEDNLMNNVTAERYGNKSQDKEVPSGAIEDSKE